MSAGHCGPLRPRKFLVGMHAYFDDAKTYGRSDITLLAGYVADNPEWDVLAREWNILLNKHRIKRLHTADFLTAKSSEYAEYADDKCSHQRRVDILREFFVPIRKHILCAFIVAVDILAYRFVFESVRKKLSPDMFCFIRLMNLIMRHMEMWTDPFPLNLVFDDSPRSKRFHELYRVRKSNDPAFDAGVASITFADDRLVPAVQAADLLACVMSKETHKPIANWMDDSPFVDILNDIDPAYGKLYMAEFWDKALLEKHAHQFLPATWKGDV